MSLIVLVASRRVGGLLGLRRAAGGKRRRGLATIGASKMDGVATKVERSLRHECGVRDGDFLLALVSGGCDSTALAHALHARQDKWSPPLEIHVLTFDHGLRPESSADADFVESLCSRLGWKCHRRALTSSEEERPTQARTRAWRRRVALEVLEEEVSGRGHVVMAHHADDARETAMLRLARGARLSKVFMGMEPTTGSTGSSSFVRPLLSMSKADLKEALEEAGEPWVEDASNLDSSKYNRNLVRLEVLPPLDKAAGGALGRRVDALRHQALAYEAWTTTVADAYEADNLIEKRLRLDGYAAQPEPVRLELLTRTCGEDGMLSYSLLRDLDALLCRERTPSGAIALNSDAWVRSLPGGLSLRRRGPYLETLNEEETSEPRVLVAGDVTITSNMSNVLVDARRSPLETASDVLVLGGMRPGMLLEIRFRRDGDRFHPTWRPRPVKLKDFLRAQQVPFEDRDKTPLLVNQDTDEILAVLTNPPFLAQSTVPQEAGENEQQHDLLWIQLRIKLIPGGAAL